MPLAGVSFIGALCLAGHAGADDRCTNQIDYSGDPRSNAEINGIGASTGVCPTPLTGVSNAIPGLIQGAVAGQPCSNYDKSIFGVSPSGESMACGYNMTGDGGVWGLAVPVIGTRPVGSSCSPGLAAQSPDGLGLICGDAGWVPGP
jgi:hypothetical protein